MPRDERRERDGRVEVGARDAEKGPGGDDEGDTEGERLAQAGAQCARENLATGNGVGAADSEIEVHGRADELSQGLDGPTAGTVLGIGHALVGWASWKLEKACEGKREKSVCCGGGGDDPGSGSIEWGRARSG